MLSKRIANYSARSSLRLQTSTSFNSYTLPRIKTILQTLHDHNDSVEFRKPVEWFNMGLLDYPHYVKHPMDLGTIRRRLRQQRYLNVEEVLDDIQLIWDNCKAYNQSNSLIYELAEKLQKSFHQMVKCYLPGLLEAQTQETSQVMQPEEDPATKEASHKDKICLVNRIKIMSPEMLKALVEFLQTDSPIVCNELEDNRLQIELQAFDSQLLRRAIEQNQPYNSKADQLLLDLDKHPAKKMKLA